MRFVMYVVPRKMRALMENLIDIAADKLVQKGRFSKLLSEVVQSSLEYLKQCRLASAWYVLTDCSFI